MKHDLRCDQLRNSDPEAWLPGLLKQQAYARPEQISVVSGTAELTFRQLDDMASRLGAVLNDRGVSPDDCVGLYVEASVDLVVGVWGILYARAAYLPLAPDYPDERLQYMLVNSGTKTVVTQSHLLERVTELAPSGTNFVTIDELPANRGWPLEQALGTNLAYVIYTSGSTGQPKGVMIENRSIVAQMQWLEASGHLKVGTRIIQKTPMSFDAAQWEILAPAVGATVVSPP